MRRLTRQERRVRLLSIVIFMLLGATIVYAFAFLAWPKRVEMPPVERRPVPAVQPSTVPPSHVPSIGVPSPTPKPTKVTIFVVANGIPDYWNIDKVVSGWNKAEHTVFTPVAMCPSFYPCVTVKMDSKIDKDYAAETTFGYRNDITIKLNPTVTNSWDAQSTACHEFGHVLGLGHISGTANTCMTAKDGFYRALPTRLDLKYADSFGDWDLSKMYTLSGKDIDVRTAPK